MLDALRGEAENSTAFLEAEIKKRPNDLGLRFTCADALHRAATMPPAEQRERMASLRSTVREFNVFRWAGRMLADAGRWRLRARVEARVRRYQAG